MKHIKSLFTYAQTFGSDFDYADALILTLGLSMEIAAIMLRP